MPIKKIKITDLVPDDKNLNKGTERGKELIETSVGRFGAGRSVLIDKNNRIIAGNKTQEAAIAKGIKDVIIVETDGTQLVAVKRNDVDLDSREGREMALADNATVKAEFVVFVGKALTNKGGVCDVRTIEEELRQGARMIEKHGAMLKLQTSRNGNGVRKNAVQFGIR